MDPRLSALIPPMEKAELCTEALKLEAEDRADLVGMILDTFDEADPNDFAGDSWEEAVRRSGRGNIRERVS